ncbi:hypothetical protein H5410_001258 [Solanum commersonii]|uniref:Uncharacterized protein n=1 Tax=Solanum commersonii TaxID=4109 RepID=A0A9J6AY66_SOLCO|nr:hypothetical protein H5410_001258 [Solanum commersonii]
MATMAQGIFSKPRAQISVSFREKSESYSCFKNILLFSLPFRYCMMGYYVNALVEWCCDICDIGKGIMFSSCGLENVHYEGPKLLFSEKICQSTVQPKKHSMFFGGHRIN